MCGIAAYIAIDDNCQGRQVIDESLELLRHRGPDGSNVFEVPGEEKSPTVVLGHTRLAIVGNGNATQPLKWTSKNKRFYLIHNGEIYNFKNLRDHLISNQECTDDDFKTDGDSEVLLACLSLQGIDCTLQSIRGMFAFVFAESLITDDGEQVKRIVAGRDPFGIKPLCYACDNPQGKIFFTSEFQALPHNIGLGSVQDVLPSSFIEITFLMESDRQKFQICEHKYEVFQSIAPCVSRDEQLSAISSNLTDAVSARIPKGVSFAVLLSGGFDSSLLCRLVADLIYPETLFTFTIATSKGALIDSDCHDLSFARLVTQEASNIVHEEVTFSFNDGLRVLPDVVKSIESTDVAMIRAGVPLHILSKHVSARGFKVVLCGEGADESMAGYRLFEDYSAAEGDAFLHELDRRLFNIDTAELQRVDRCTSAHGLEARVPFMDVDYVKVAMGIPAEEKMAHPSLGRIQKYLLRRAFDEEHYKSKITNKQLLPDSVLYREKEQFADGVGRDWIAELQQYASNLFPGLSLEDAERELYQSYLVQLPGQNELLELIQNRQVRRKQNAHDGRTGKPGSTQPMRWYPVRYDPDLTQLALSKSDATYFLQRVLGWSRDDAIGFFPSLQSLNKVIVSMLERVPFHNLTLLTRPRRPPTMTEIKEDMMSGIGGPCAVVNSFFAVILDKLGFGPHVFLLSCEINKQRDCHVAILVQFKGLRYFVDVANAKPYRHAVHLGDLSTFTGLDGSFSWGLRYNQESGLVELHHGNETAISFHPARTVRYSSFYAMIARSRSDASFGPFLTGLRYCLYPEDASRILAVKDACIFNGNSGKLKHCASTKLDVQTFAVKPPFADIPGFKELIDEAIAVLERENPGWFDRSRRILLEKGIAE
ncbi:hypothetical protein ACHAWF_017645, partial [Thalassiosira exigua]